MLKVITVCNDLQYAQPLIRSLFKHQWDYVAIEASWKGFGTKLIETYNYLKAHPEVTEFIFCDAYDVLCFGTPGEFIQKLANPYKMLVSAEKGLWPPSLQPFRNSYKIFEHGFNFLNSGLYYAPSGLFIQEFENNPPFYEIDDQLWMNLKYLLQVWIDGGNITCDNAQTVFNSHSFIAEGEYGYNGRIQILGNEPVFIHSNARTIDEKLNELTRT